MPISPPANPRLGQVYQEAGVTYTWEGTTWVETTPGISSIPFPTIQDINFVAGGPTGPAGGIGPTGSSGGPIGPTGYTGYTGPLPDFGVSYGPDNALSGAIHYDTSSTEGLMWVDNPTTNFTDAINKLNLGDTFTGTLISSPGNITGTYTFSLASLPTSSGRGDLSWTTYENDIQYIGSYGLLTFNSLKGKTGATGATGPAGAGFSSSGNTQITSNLIPATSNVYSLGNSTHWWKDIWISANTFYVGGSPISVNADGHITIGNLEVTGSINGAVVDNIINSASSEPVMSYNYKFDTTISDWNTYGVNNAIPDGKFTILGVGWPERPGVSLFGFNQTTGSYVNYLKMSGITSDGKDIYQELKDKFAAAQYPNPTWNFIRLTETSNPGNYCVFYIPGSLTSNDSSKTVRWDATWVAGTVTSDIWTGSNTSVTVEFSQKTMHGRIPLLDAQKYWWGKPHAFGPGFDMAVPYHAPLCCSGLWLYPPATNTGTVNFPTGNIWVGKSVTVWVFGNSIAKSNIVNVTTTNLPTTITADSFFNITYLDNTRKWVVTYQGNV